MEVIVKYDRVKYIIRSAVYCEQVFFIDKEHYLGNKLVYVKQIKCANDINQEELANLFNFNEGRQDE
jgi:hypothetical protein